MKIHEKYLEALKKFDDHITVSEWAIKFGELYPELLEKAEREAKNHKKPSTGLREISARISSWISTGDFDKYLEIDNSERPRKVKFISEEEFEKNTNHDIEEDLEPLTRREKEQEGENSFLVQEYYRYDEFKNIQKSFKNFFAIDFEIDHAKALLNKEAAGIHHPDNFQFLLKHHNAKKNNKNWKRFTFDEQSAYIKKTIELQLLISSRLRVDMNIKILDSLLHRLKLVY